MNLGNIVFLILWSSVIFLLGMKTGHECFESTKEKVAIVLLGIITLCVGSLLTLLAVK